MHRVQLLADVHAFLLFFSRLLLSCVSWSPCPVTVPPCRQVWMADPPPSCTKGGRQTRQPHSRRRVPQPRRVCPCLHTSELDTPRLCRGHGRQPAQLAIRQAGCGLLTPQAPLPLRRRTLSNFRCLGSSTGTCRVVSRVVSCRVVSTRTVWPCPRHGLGCVAWVQGFEVFCCLFCGNCVPICCVYVCVCVCVLWRLRSYQGGSPVAEVAMRRSLHTAGSWSSATVAPVVDNAYSGTLTGLSIAETYDVQVAACNAAHECGPYSTLATARTLPSLATIDDLPAVASFSAISASDTYVIRFVAALCMYAPSSNRNGFERMPECCNVCGAWFVFAGSAGEQRN